MYTKTYYGAFVFDPDGNNLEAMYRDHEKEAQMQEACAAGKEQA